MADGRIPDDLVSLAKACELAGVSRRTLYTWRDRGLVEVFYTAGGAPRVSKAQLILRAKPGNDVQHGRINT